MEKRPSCESTIRGGPLTWASGGGGDQGVLSCKPELDGTAMVSMVTQKCTGYQACFSKMSVRSCEFQRLNRLILKDSSPVLRTDMAVPHMAAEQICERPHPMRCLGFLAVTVKIVLSCLHEKLGKIAWNNFPFKLRIFDS